MGLTELPIGVVILIFATVLAVIALMIGFIACAVIGHWDQGWEGRAFAITITVIALMSIIGIVVLIIEFI